MPDTQPTMSIDENGTKIWKLNGKFHREDGPAFEHTNGSRGWWLNDKRYSFDNWLDVNNYLTDQEKVMMKLIYG